MIQDIGPHVYKNEYRPQEPTHDSYVMHFVNGALMGQVSEGQVMFPTFAQIQEKNPNAYEDAVYLFEIDERKFYLVDNVLDADGFELLGKERFRTLKPEHMAFAGITAYQLHNWYQNHKFCGKCGNTMKKDKKERMLYCESCHNMEYPKICPAVIVGLTDGNRLLLTKYAGREYAKYALVAGFAEIGESIEDTVRREVMEEVGLRVKNITYYKSQPWSFTDTLLFGFYCELDGSPEITLDETELAVAEWFEREEIPVKEKSVSLTNEMILHFKNGMHKE